MKSIKKIEVIAEIAQSHGGSLEKAKKMILLCKKAGADYVKFQAHYAKYESTFNEPFRKGYKFKENSRYDYWKKYEFTKKQWKILIDFSRRNKIKFLCSPFSVYAYEVLKSLGIKKWKIGSGEFFSDNLIKRIVKDKGEIYISTGLSTLNEINNKINFFKKKNTNFTLIQCTTKYPTKIKDVGINVLDNFKKKYKCKIGLSDHTGSISPALYAISKEYNLIEVHVDFKTKNNPDTSSSISFDELKIICNYRDDYWKLKTIKVNKDLISKSLKNFRKNFTKSLCLNKNLSKGQKIKRNDLTLKKPGNGINALKINSLIGKIAKKNLSDKYLLKWSDFE